MAGIPKYVGYDPAENAWRKDAACRGVDGAAEIFFPEGTKHVDELVKVLTAQKFCAVCPADKECLEGALCRAEPCGVWGGHVFVNGRPTTSYVGTLRHRKAIQVTGSDPLHGEALAS